MGRMASQFIPFSKYLSSDEELSKYISADNNQQDLMSLAVLLSVDSGKILEGVSQKNIEDYKKAAAKLKENLDCFLSKINTPIEPVKENLTPSIDHSYKQFNLVEVEKKERVLENGGMAPPKEWKSITELSLKNSEKNSLIEEMRKLSAEGKTFIKPVQKNYSISIEEFTSPFSYLENVHDYNGSFLIRLLKSSIEIDNEAAQFKVDLSNEKKACTNGDLIILHVYDINSSISDGEEKKFLLTLHFDKLNGFLRQENHKVFFLNNKQHKLSNKQVLELKRFCETKKIN
jgi:hypothetical protein